MSETTPTDALTLDQLRVFLAVVDAGGFSAASRALRRAQSAVSYAIANLERQLGVSLFERSGRKPTTTAAGQALASEARAVVDRVDRLKARARGIASGVEPRVGIAVDVLFPLPALVRGLGEFSARFPTVALELRTEVLGAVAQLVADGVCSVGIAGPLPKWPDGIERRPLTRIPMAWVASKDHPLARLRGAIPTEAAREHVQIVLADRSRLTEGHDLGVLSSHTWRVLDLAAKHALLRAGLGWGGMPLHSVAEDLARKRLVRLRLVELDGDAHAAPLFSVHRVAEPPGPAARWLIERLATGCVGK
jgi:DNA-binding transcriptional LysR family regulator